MWVNQGLLPGHRACDCEAMANIPAATELERIALHPDLVLRNLLITDAYHRLAVAVRSCTGSGANWCTFATWASKQAGRTIRREDLREFLRARLRESPELSALAHTAIPIIRALGAAHSAEQLIAEVAGAIDSDPAFGRAAQSVAEGNLKVFQEIAIQFARFLAAETSDDPAAFEQFSASLLPGDPPEGQRLLADAFASYHHALNESDPGARAQRLFYANVLIGLHEQTRLQPQIAAALNAGFDEANVRKRLLAALLPSFWRRIRYAVSAWFGRKPPFDELLDRLLPQVQRDLRHIVTREVMTLQFPGGVVVRLGQDLTGGFPQSLAVIAHPQLAALIKRFDLTPDSVQGTGARDWSVLGQRMHLIIDLFRCRHEWAPLFDPPFSAAQVADLQAGRRPGDPL
jgi:hypothetical protein